MVKYISCRKNPKKVLVNLFLTIVFTDNQWDAFVSVILSLENFPPYILSYNNKNKYLGKYLVLYRYYV
jgi:hypothetical protein